MDQVLSFLAEFSATTYYILALVMFLFLVMIIAVHRYLKKTEDKRRLRNVAYQMGVDFLTDITLPDGVDGYISFECCLLTSKAIVVFNVQNYPGLLFGGKNTDLWTQMFRQKSFKFNNPLPYNEYCVQSVRALIPNVPIVGRVVFTDAGHFPKGLPPNVSILSGVLDDLRQYVGKEEVPIRLQLAWQYLQSRVVQEKIKNPITRSPTRELQLHQPR